MPKPSLKASHLQAESINANPIDVHYKVKTDLADSDSYCWRNKTRLQKPSPICPPRACNPEVQSEQKKKTTKTWVPPTQYLSPFQKGAAASSFFGGAMRRYKASPVNRRDPNR